MDLSDAEVALLAAEAGTAVVRRMYRTPVAHHLKVGTDFATDADLEAERGRSDSAEPRRSGRSETAASLLARC
jgi:myo-inositol-1(or 4)-monophosphatase